ncbi:MAG: hypothetical protein XD95_0495 [Microgenomates bacterium 39_7]|nr:MAG: hypothetical protein XD95_0495 [Microgenomates bacterium 39_7]
MKLVLRLILLFAIMAGLIFGYYYLMRHFAISRDNQVSREQIQQWQQATTRSEPIVVVGKLIRENSLYYLNLGNEGKIQVQSTALSLSSYVDMQVEIVAEFKDDILQVYKIQELD